MAEVSREERFSETRLRTINGKLEAVPAILILERAVGRELLSPKVREVLEFWHKEHFSEIVECGMNTRLSERDFVDEITVERSVVIGESIFDELRNKLAFASPLNERSE